MECQDQKRQQNHRIKEPWFLRIGKNISAKAIGNGKGNTDRRYYILLFPQEKEE